MRHILALFTTLTLSAGVGVAQPAIQIGEGNLAVPRDGADTSFLTKRNQLAFDFGPLGASVSFAQGEGTGGFVGISAGVGGSVCIRRISLMQDWMAFTVDPDFVEQKT